MPPRTVAATALAAAWFALGVAVASATGEQPPPPPLPSESPIPSPSQDLSSSSLSPSPTTEPLSLSPPSSRRAYARFHANDSFVGQLINCSRQEKICFGFNTLYYPEERRCLRREDARLFVGNRRLFDNGRGRLVAERLRFRDECPGWRMAWDGRCYSRAAVLRLCGCGAPPTRHFLGGVECRCDAPPLLPSKAAVVQQPEEGGVCRVPDLRAPDYQRYGLRGDPSGLVVPIMFLRCTAHQATCFNAGRVAVGGADGCAELHTRGPCPRDHVVALDEQPAAEGRRAEGTCVHVRGHCPRGQRRLAHDGHCHTDEEVELVRPGQLLLTAFGRHVLIAPGHLWRVKLSVSTLIEIRYHFRVCTVEYMGNRTERRTLPDAPPGAKDEERNKVYRVADLPPE